MTNRAGGFGLAALLLLGACGGGAGSSAPPGTPPSGLVYASPQTYYVGTAIQPLVPSVIGAVTSYSVSPALPAGMTMNATTGIVSGTPTVAAASTVYTVTAQNRAGQTTFGLSLIVYATHTIGGTLSGLEGGQRVTLLDNGGSPLALSANGAFTFAAAVVDNGSYNVTVSTQPIGQACSVGNGVGTAVVADVSSVSVNCTDTSGLALLAGSPYGPGSLDGTGGAASFFIPLGVAADNAGNVYVADTDNCTIRKITAAGVVTTLAGKAEAYGSSDGAGAAARFRFPQAVAVDTFGNLYVSDSGNHTIRKITAAGVVTTLAGAAGVSGSADGTGTAARFYLPVGIAVDGAGNVFVADKYNHTIREVTPAGVVTTLAGAAGVSGSADGTGAAAKFYWPAGVTVDSAGNVFVADSQNSTIRKITPGGAVTTLAGTAGTPGASDGPCQTASFSYPGGVAVDAAGTLYVAESTTVRKITPSCVVTTFAGTASMNGSADGEGAAARFGLASSVAAASDGNLYVTDIENNTIRKITSAGSVSTFAGTAGEPGGADGTGAAARFYSPRGVTTDSAGNIYVADEVNGTIRKVTPAGDVTTFAGTERVWGSADGTGAAARFDSPQAVAADSDGNVYVADMNNCTIRKITAAGSVTTLAGTAGELGSADGSGEAARFRYPRGVATDTAGNVYVADTENASIRKITPTGVVTTLAGTAAGFVKPTGIAVDSGGNVFVADVYDHTIRKITPGGSVSIYAGTRGVPGGDDGPGLFARFNAPTGLAVSADGHLFVADSNNYTIRIIAPNGIVYTLIGTKGVAGFRPGTPAGCRRPDLRRRH